MSAGPKIAIVAREVRGLSGTVTTILEQARRLSGRGWSVHVYGERLDREALRAAGAAAHAFPGWPWGSYLKRRLFAALADRAVSRGGYDLVHGHGDGFSQDVLSLHNCVHAAHEDVHEGETLPRPSGVGRIHETILRERLFRLLIANSRLMQDEVVSRFGVAREQTVVIYPGHDPARFRAMERERLGRPLRWELGVAEDDVLFGLITSGDFKKRGVDVFLKALGLAARGLGPRIKALVIGKESKLGPYLRKAGVEGVSGAVRFLPPSADVARYYHALDVYVHPAHYEEFGQSVQEALACGLAVLTNEKVGASELMTGSLREFVLPRTGAEGLAVQMKALAGDPERRGRLAALGPAAVAANTWDRNFESTVAVYDTLLKNR